MDSSVGSGLWTARQTWPAFVLSHDPLTGVTALARGGVVERSWADPLVALDWLEGEGRKLLVDARDRWVGYLSYDLGRLFETIPSTTVDDLGLPLFRFTLHRAGEAAVGSAHVTDAARVARAVGGAGPTSTFTREGYEAAVGRAIEYVRAGDIFQVNLAQRFAVPTSLAPAEIYRRLLARSPAEYGALLDYGDFALVSNSPELFLRVTPETGGGRRVMTRPIKGTRPRLPGMDEELRDSAKDAAELHMIVDLERNDLGRVCEIGSVKVTQTRTIEAHPTVFHGVATVEGRPRDDVGLVDLLRAAFPGGSITGAPKIRAMQIVEELEPVRRGPYCGAIGVLAPGGALELNVAIRTMVLK
ncbi:MAG TPA: anthranilate synthase component I family protein, partial [Tepidisphaeraceae bacterium]|nr:anthranilate synthase component I family protein [Tepidisphaeraceae bacterium]